MAENAAEKPDANSQKAIADRLGAIIPAGREAPPDSPEVGAFVMRARTGFFGHNAPRWEMLPKHKSTRGSDPGGKNPYENSWDGFKRRTIWSNSQGVAWGRVEPESYPGDVYLDRVVPELVAGSWVVFDDAETAVRSKDRYQPFHVTGVTEASIADYALSPKATAFQLSKSSRCSSGFLTWV